MSDLMSIGLSGLRAFQHAIDVTGHNIANANTPGYSRQVTEFAARIGDGQGNHYVGSGTQITTVRRMYDDLLGRQMQAASTGYGRLDMLNTLSGRLDTLLADPDTGLNSALETFFGAVQDVNNDPASVPARQALLGEAESLAQRFQTLDRRLAETDTEVNRRISLAVDDVNGLAGSIAEVNQRIALAQGSTGRPPNDLLDQRDLLVQKLSSQVSVTTALQDDGTLNVFIGSGQSLVIGTEAKQLAVTSSEFDATRLEVTYEGFAGGTPLDSGSTGGALGGLIDFRRDMLDPARQALGQAATALALEFNRQHASGVDLRGDTGEQFFGLSAPTILGSRDNTGSGTPSANVSDVKALTGADYVLEFDGTAYSLTRADTGQAVAMTGSGSAGDPFVADGLEITIGGAPAAGDRYMIRSSHDAAASLDALVSDPRAIAIAAPTRIVASQDNLGDAEVSAPVAVDPADPGLFATALIEFTSATTYTVDGGGPFAYVEGDPITVNGSQFTISGTPVTGDEFTLEANTGASGDNRNGQFLADVQSVGILDGGAVSISESYSQLVASVGTSTRQVQANLDAQTVVMDNVQDSLQANSGVNLDEEAANLIRYQQAYQAAAQVIGIANTLFDSLLSATRR